LGPFLRISVDRIHIQRTHARSNEENSQHGCEIHGGGSGHQGSLSLACEIGCVTNELRPATRNLNTLQGGY